MNKLNIVIPQPKDSELDKVRVYYRVGKSIDGLHSDENKIYEGVVANISLEEYDDKTLFRIGIEYFNDAGKIARSIPRAPSMKVKDLGPWAYCSKDPIHSGDEVIGALETRDTYFPSNLRVMNHHHQKFISAFSETSGVVESSWTLNYPQAETNHLIVDGEIVSIYNYPVNIFFSTTQLNAIKRDMETNPEKYQINIGGFIWQCEFFSRKVMNALATCYNAVSSASAHFPKPSPIARLISYNGTITTVISSYYSRAAIWVEEVEVDGVVSNKWHRWLSQVMSEEEGTYVPTSDSSDAAISGNSTTWPVLLRYIGRAED